MRAFKTARARSDTSMRGRAMQTALNTFHLWTTLSGGREDDAICVATWARVSGRRPKGVVGWWDCMPLPSVRQRKTARQNDDRHETLDCDSRKWDSLSCHTTKKGFRGGDVSGAFFLSCVCSWYDREMRPIRPRFYPHGSPPEKRRQTMRESAPRENLQRPKRHSCRLSASVLGLRGAPARSCCPTSTRAPYLDLAMWRSGFRPCAEWLRRQLETACRTVDLGTDPL